MSFSEIQGQPQVVAALKSALAKNQLPHAILFTGPPGSGQRAMAVELAKAVLCEQKNGEEPCDVCLACRQAAAGSHPDFVVVEPEAEAAVIKVEALRALIARSHLKPLRGHRQVLAIDRAECLNDVSQNALLKTLEEPSGHALFILIASGMDTLLPTVRSRLQTLHFFSVRRPGVADPVKEQLKNQTLAFILSQTDTSPDLSRLDRRTLAEIMDFLMETFREALILRVGAGELLGPDSPRPAALEISRTFEEAELEERIELFSEAKKKILGYLNVKLTLSVLWDTI